MANRYTAVIKIVKVTEHPGTGRGDDKSFNEEIANVVVRNGTLEKLIAQTKAHLDLVGE